MTSKVDRLFDVIRDALDGTPRRMLPDTVRVPTPRLDERFEGDDLYELIGAPPSRMDALLFSYNMERGAYYAVGRAPAIVGFAHNKFAPTWAKRICDLQRTLTKSERFVAMMRMSRFGYEKYFTYDERDCYYTFGPEVIGAKDGKIVCGNVELGSWGGNAFMTRQQELGVLIRKSPYTRHAVNMINKGVPEDVQRLVFGAFVVHGIAWLEQVVIGENGRRVTSYARRRLESYILKGRNVRRRVEQLLVPCHMTKNEFDEFMPKGETFGKVQRELIWERLNELPQFRKRGSGNE